MHFAKLIQFLLEAVRAEFFGEITIRFRKGQITFIKREETWEPEHLPVKDTEVVEMMRTGRWKIPA